MEEVKHDGGPAFPSILGLIGPPSDSGRVGVEGFQGMSMRDYFAGQALAGIVQAFPEAAAAPAAPGIAEIAEDAYILADAMLAARAK